MTFKIKSLKARELLDSRGNPTVEVELSTGSCKVSSMVPSGASTGVHEALELRDENEERFHGKGVQKTVENVTEKIAPKLEGKDVRNQKHLDELMIELDGTDNKSNFGANAILGVSMCLTRASAKCKQISLYERIAELSENNFLLLPVPSMNIINGGEHAGNKIDIQEYMLMPTGADSFHEAMRIGSEVYHELKSILREKFGKNAANVGDEGGFAPPLDKPHEPMDYILQAAAELGYENKVELAIDAAASEFYHSDRYILQGQEMNGEDLGTVYEDMINDYPLASIEDPFAEDDWYSWKKFMQYFGDEVQVVGDDLLVTNVERIQKALDEEACNALLLKINQIGSITESIQASEMAMDNGWNVMVSHRSGETEDPFIADLVVGLGTGQIKSGAPCRSERNAKYNELMRIEEQLKEKGADVEYQGAL